MAAQLTSAIVRLAKAFGGPGDVSAFADREALWSLFSGLDRRRFDAAAHSTLSAAELARSTVAHFHETLGIHAPLVDRLVRIVELDNEGSPGEDADTLCTFLEAWLGAAINSDIKDDVISNIMELSEEDQAALMESVERLMAAQSEWHATGAGRKSPAGGAASRRRGSSAAGGSSELVVELHAARAEIEDLRAQNEQLQARIRDAAGASAGSRALESAALGAATNSDA